eukprot:m51a1_g10896 putative protein memo1 (896) ;mRNA; f:23131-27746
MAAEEPQQYYDLSDDGDVRLQMPSQSPLFWPRPVLSATTVVPAPVLPPLELSPSVSPATSPNMRASWLRACTPPALSPATSPQVSPMLGPARSIFAVTPEETQPPAFVPVSASSSSPPTAAPVPRPVATRPAFWAGKRYPSQSLTLSTLSLSQGLEPGPAKVVMMPHAMMQNCDRVMAAAARAIPRSTSTVIVIGPFHKRPAPPVGVSTFGVLETPIGITAVDMMACSTLVERGVAEFVAAERDREEYSIEAVLPFVQSVVPRATIVPLYVGDCSSAQLKAAASVVAQLMASPNVAVVVTCDFGHWGAKYGWAKIDPKYGTGEPAVRATIGEANYRFMNTILPFDVSVFADNVRNSLCGGNALALAMFTKVSTPNVNILHHRGVVLLVVLVLSLGCSALVCTPGTAVEGVLVKTTDPLDTLQTDSDCWELCQAEVLCSAWTAEHLQDPTAHVRCHLFASPAAVVRSSPDNCSAVQQCQGRAVFDSEVNLVAPFATAGGSAECASACRADASCAGYRVITTIALKQCQLLSSVGAAQSTSTTSCVAEARCTASTGLPAPTLATVPVTGGDLECAARCRAHTGCAAYTLSAAVDRGTWAMAQNCSLKGALQGLATDAPGSCSAALACDPARGLQGGSVVGRQYVRDDRDCARLCADNSSCSAFSIEAQGVAGAWCTMLSGAVLAATPDSSLCSRVLQCRPGTSLDSDTSLSLLALQGDSECAATSALVCRLYSSYTSVRAGGLCVGVLNRTELGCHPEVTSSSAELMCDGDHASCFYVHVHPLSGTLDREGLAQDLATALNKPGTKLSVYIVGEDQDGLICLVTVGGTSEQPQELADELKKQIDDPLSVLWKLPAAKQLVKKAGVTPFVKHRTLVSAAAPLHAALLLWAMAAYASAN